MLTCRALTLPRPLIAALEADDCEIQFVQSTNAEDHGGILHEKQAQAARNGVQQQDVKPRLSQARLPSASQQPHQQRGASRASSFGPGVHAAAAAASRSGSARNASVAGRPQSTPMPGPRSKASSPLFAPKEEEEGDAAVYNDTSANISRVSRTSYGTSSRRDSSGVGSNAQPITLDDDDDDDEEALWGVEEPSFSQAVATMDLDASQQSRAKAVAKVGANWDRKSAGTDGHAKPASNGSGKVSSTTVQREQPQEEEMGISLDDTEMDLTYEDLEEDEDFLHPSRPGGAGTGRAEAGVSENSKKKKVGAFSSYL